MQATIADGFIFGARLESTCSHYEHRSERVLACGNITSLNYNYIIYSTNTFLANFCVFHVYSTLLKISVSTNTLLSRTVQNNLTWIRIKFLSTSVWTLYLVIYHCYLIKSSNFMRQMMIPANRIVFIILVNKWVRFVYPRFLQLYQNKSELFVETEILL